MQPHSQKRSPSWAQRTVIEAAEQRDCPFWASRHFHVEDRSEPESGVELGSGPILLANHQRRIIRAALERDAAGRFRWTTVVYSCPKKSGKTRVAAMVAAWLAATMGPFQEVYCLANDGKQSADRVLAAIKKANELGRLGWTDRLTSVTLPNGSFVEAVPVDPTGEAGANPTATFWCLDADTEVLTCGGWKTWQTLEDWHLIATLAPSGDFQWQPSNGIFLNPNYSGPMLSAETKRVSMLVTPNHRLYARAQNGRGQKGKRGRSFALIPASEAATHKVVSVCAAAWGWHGEHQESFTLPGTKRRPSIRLPMADWVQFMAWYLSEGCVLYGRNRHPEGVLIAQDRDKNFGKWVNIERTIRALGFKPCPRKEGSGFEIWDVRLARYCQAFGLSHQKYIPSWLMNLSRDDLSYFLNTYRQGDGWEHGRGFDIGTISQAMVDCLLEIGQKCGYYVSYTGYHDARSQYKQFKVRFRPGHEREPQIGVDQWHTVDYSGPIFCPSTYNGVILVRRHGKVYWTGNSEMWGFRLSAKERLWSEFTIPPTRFGRAIRWVESYAGYTGESPVLEQLYHEGVTEGAPHPGFPDLPVTINERARLFCYWDTVGRMAWQTPEYYQAEAALLHPSEFERIHRNQWVSAVGEAIPAELWDLCYDPNLSSAIDPRAPAVLGVDLGMADDHTALVLVTRHPANHDMAAIRWVKVWEPPAGGKMDYTATIAPEIRRLCKQYAIVACVYDDWQAHHLMTELRQEGLTRFIAFPQGDGSQQRPGRTIADKQLLDIVVSRKLAHNGDPILKQHVQNAAAKLEGDKKLRFVKRGKGKVDALIAASMATFECLRLNV